MAVEFGAKLYLKDNMYATLKKNMELQKRQLYCPHAPKEKERPLWTPLLNNGRKLCYETLWLNHNRAS